MGAEPVGGGAQWRAAGHDAAHVALDVVFVLLGVQYAANDTEHPGFRDRVAGSMLAAMIEGPSSSMTQRDEDGSITLLSEHLPEEVVAWFPDIWTYLLTGEWPAPITQLSDQLSWARAVRFLGVVAEDSDYQGEGMLVFGDRMLLLPQDRLLGASCVLFERSGAIADSLQGVPEPCGLVQQRVCSGSPLQAVSVGLHARLQLDSRAGEVYAKFEGSPNYTYFARHPLLKGRLARSAIMRRAESQFAQYGCGFIIFLLMVPRSYCSQRFQTSSMAKWPCFWLVLCAKRLDGGYSDRLSAPSSGRGDRDRRGYECASLEVLPGGLRTMVDGTVVLLSKYESLRSTLLSIYRVESGVIQLPPILVNPVAPQPYWGPDNGDLHVPGGLHKGAWKGSWSTGSQTHDLHGKGPARLRFPSLRTLHPQGRAPAQVWLVRRGRQLVLLVHAVDGRVALGQITGPGGPMPPLPLTMRVRWDVWCRHTNDAFSDEEGRWLTRWTLRRRFAVPLCSEVLALIPRDSEIVIAHRLRPGDPARLWRAPLSPDGCIEKSFIPLVSVAKGSGAAKGGGKGKGSWPCSTGSWPDNMWFSNVPCSLPPHLDGRHACEVLEGESEQPSFEFLRWQVLHSGASPIPLQPSIERSTSGCLPVIIGPHRHLFRFNNPTHAMSATPYGCPPRQIWTDAPRAPTLNERTGQWRWVHLEPLVEHWMSRAQV